MLWASKWLRSIEQKNKTKESERGKLTSSSKANRPGDRQNLTILQQRGMGCEAHVNAQPGGQHTEGISPPEAVTRHSDLRDALGAQVCHALGEDRVDGGGAMAESPVCGVEAWGCEVEWGGIVVEHVWGYG